MISITNMKELYIDQLRDLYSANKQSKSVTEKLVNKATNPELKSALEAGVKGIDEGMKTLTQLIESHGGQRSGEFCKGMEGIVKEVKAHAIDADIADRDVMDASIITQYQRMAHYGIAGYGTAKAFAKRLGLKDDALQIETMLDNTYSGDRHMTDLAEGKINAKAMT